MLKIYEITNVGNIDSYTVYFVNSVNDNKYYIPVTKYVNDYKQDKIRIIIDELASSFTYQSKKYLENLLKLTNMIWYLQQKIESRKENMVLLNLILNILF